MAFRVILPERVRTPSTSSARGDKITGSKQPLDVLLVNSGSRTAVYQELGDRYSAIEPPSLAGLFATYLKKRGLAVAIVDAPALNLSPAGVAGTIRDNFEPVQSSPVFMNWHCNNASCELDPSQRGGTPAAPRRLVASFPAVLVYGLRQCMADLSLKRGFVITTGEERRSIGKAIEILPRRSVRPRRGGHRLIRAGRSTPRPAQFMHQFSQAERLHARAEGKTLFARVDDQPLPGAEVSTGLAKSPLRLWR